MILRRRHSVSDVNTGVGVVQWSNRQLRSRWIRFLFAAVRRTVISVDSPRCWRKCASVTMCVLLCRQTCWHCLEILGIDNTWRTVCTGYISFTSSDASVSAESLSEIGITLNFSACDRRIESSTAVVYPPGKCSMRCRSFHLFPCYSCWLIQWCCDAEFHRRSD